MGDLIGLIFMVLVLAFVVGFVLYKNLYYKGKRRVNREPDLLEAALLKKQIAENRLVINVPSILVIGKE